MLTHCDGWDVHTVEREGHMAVYTFRKSIDGQWARVIIHESANEPFDDEQVKAILREEEAFLRFNPHVPLKRVL